MDTYEIRCLSRDEMSVCADRLQEAAARSPRERSIAVATGSNPRFGVRFKQNADYGRPLVIFAGAGIYHASASKPIFPVRRDGIQACPEAFGASHPSG